jgi:hypothetical protein
MHDISLERRQDTLTQALLGRFGVPAYVRRARGVQDALDGLQIRCRQQRRQWAADLRGCLTEVLAAVGGWDSLVAAVGEPTSTMVKALWEELTPEERPANRVAVSPARQRRLLNDLVSNVRRLNSRFQDHLEHLDLTPINELRDGYNRYYLLEKECALRSPMLALQGFRRLEPLTTAELVELLPPLPVPDPATWG